MAPDNNWLSFSLSSMEMLNSSSSSSHQPNDSHHYYSFGDNFYTTGTLHSLSGPISLSLSIYTYIAYTYVYLYVCVFLSFFGRFVESLNGPCWKSCFKTPRCLRFFAEINMLRKKVRKKQETAPAPLFLFYSNFSLQNPPFFPAFGYIFGIFPLN